MDKSVDRYIRDNVLRNQPLHQQQFAYQAGKSTETALHNVTKQTDLQQSLKILAEWKKRSFCMGAGICGYQWQ
jgi:hypothetical protein